MTGVKMTHVPYKGSVQVVNAMLAGDIQLTFDSISTSMPQPDLRAQIAANGYEPVGSTPSALGAHIEAELVRWNKVVTGAGVKLE